jgi:hypothetical protein
MSARDYRFSRGAAFSMEANASRPRCFTQTSWQFDQCSAGGTPEASQAEWPQLCGISALTLGSRLHKKCVAPIQALIVPNGCSAVCVASASRLDWRRAVTASCRARPRVPICRCVGSPMSCTLPAERSAGTPLANSSAQGEGLHGRPGVQVGVEFGARVRRQGHQAPSFDKTAFATAVASSDVLSCPGAVAWNVRPPPLNTTAV